MAQIINTNIPSLNTQRNLSTTNGQLAQAIQRLSSGLRVNSAKDDAAGLAIAERMNSQVRGMNVAIRNANDGISMAQVAEGALGKVGDMLQRMRELAVQSANATNSSSDRDNLNAEFTQLSAEIDRTLEGTKFNGKAILGTDAASMTFQIGAGTSATDTIDVNTSDMTSDSDLIAVIAASIDGSDATNASEAIDLIDAALDRVNTERATMGAMQNRFESIIGNLQVATENQSAARSRIMDADFAAETAALTRAQILQQAGNAMLAQANQIPQNVLQLLRS
ncbi:MAG: flagellin FliC [Burkholderiaceae bacterium]|nr:flagellin FliC [Burkholderiaceae bacterium]